MEITTKKPIPEKLIEKILSYNLAENRFNQALLLAEHTQKGAITYCKMCKTGKFDKVALDPRGRKMR